MNPSIHPKWFADARVTCACGNSFTIGATKQQINIDICSRCHPFFTGEMKFVDTLGRVERFQQRMTQAQSISQVITNKKKKKKDREDAIARQPKSLKEMLMGLK